MTKLSCEACGSTLVVFDNKEYACEYCKSIYPMPQKKKKLIEMFLLLKIRPSMIIIGLCILVLNWYLIENQRVTLMQKTLITLGVIGDYTDRSYYQTGELESEFKYSSNKVDGIMTKYYKDGRVKETLPYKNGLRDGKCIEYYKSGKKHLEWEYKKDRIVGGTGYYSSGKLKYLFSYKDGLRDGITKEYYTTGELSMDWLYKNNQLITGTKGYYKNSKVRWNPIYKNGKLIK